EARRLLPVLDARRALPLAWAVGRVGTARVRSRQRRRALRGLTGDEPLQCLPPRRVRPPDARGRLRARLLPPGYRLRSPRRPSLSQTLTETALPSSTRLRLGHALAWLERLASRRLGAVVLFVLGLAVYTFRAVGWPLIGGRDLDEYLFTYIQF